jgi:hypothetical protein
MPEGLSGDIVLEAKELNHRGHRGTQRFKKALSRLSVASVVKDVTSVVGDDTPRTVVLEQA